MHVKTFDISIPEQMPHYIFPVFPVDLEEGTIRSKHLLFRLLPILQALVEVGKYLIHDHIIVVFSHSMSISKESELPLQIKYQKRSHQICQNYSEFGYGDCFICILCSRISCSLDLDNRTFFVSIHSYIIIFPSQYDFSCFLLVIYINI